MIKQPITQGLQCLLRHSFKDIHLQSFNKWTNFAISFWWLYPEPFNYDKINFHNFHLFNGLQLIKDNIYLTTLGWSYQGNPAAALPCVLAEPSSPSSGDVRSITGISERLGVWFVMITELSRSLVSLDDVDAEGDIGAGWWKLEISPLGSSRSTDISRGEPGFPLMDDDVLSVSLWPIFIPIKRNKNFTRKFKGLEMV